jgi:cytochrome c oxidase assembly factor CtaG
MVDHMVMFSLIAVLGVFGANAVLARKFGADSRTNDERPNW